MLEEIRTYIRKEHAIAIDKGIYIENCLGILMVLQQINDIVEYLYSDIDDEMLIDEYISLREKILYC